MTISYDGQNKKITNDQLATLVLEYAQTAINVFTLFSVSFLALLTLLFYKKRK